MKAKVSLALVVLTAALGGCVSNKPANDPALVGSWKGLREESSKCQFLSWRNQLKADGSFVITFFRDAQQAQPIQTEYGTWVAANGTSSMKTNGVRTPDIYTYKVIDADSVHYVNVAADPSGDCQEDYAFTEHRIGK